MREDGTPKGGSTTHDRMLLARFWVFFTVLLWAGSTQLQAQIQTSVPSLSGFIQTNTIPCPPQSYVVSARNISADVVVTAPTGFEISLNQITWVAPPASITIGQSGPDSIPPTTIHVRLNTPILGTYTGNIVHTSTDSPSLNLPVDGIRSAKSPTTTALLASPNPSVFGQLVTLTANVSSPLPGTPTGTVTFFDGGTSLGTATLNLSASATLITSVLTFGSHNLSATYNADAAFDSSTSSTLSQFVQGTTTTVVISNNNPSVSGQSVTFTATVSSSFPGTPTGSVTFYDGASSLGSTVLSGGNAALSTSALTPGSHAVTASYNGDVSFAGSTSPVVTQMVKAITTTGLASNHNPSVSGQLVTLTASVASVTPGTITGTVTFFDGASPLGGPVTVAGGTAAYSATYAASGGSHSFTATYNGDPNYASSTSSAVSQTVNKASSAAVITANPNPSYVGQLVTITATVNAVAPGSGTPTGSVTFSIDGSPFGPVSMTGGIASMATSSLTLGLHTFSGSYSGDGDFDPITSSAYADTVDPIITATAGPHGSISPSGLVLAPYGGNQVFVITPSVGYHVDSVFVDSVMVDSTSSYTFVNVTANHTIRAVFRINQYTIMASAGPNGTISPDGAVSVDYGSSQAFTSTPDTGYHVDSVLVDGVKVDSTTSYTFVNVTTDHTIRTVFRVNVSPKFLTLTPDSVFAQNPLKPGKSLKAVKRAKLGKPIDPLKNIPNWSNLLSEVVAQGGFQPGMGEGDSAGGAVIGLSFMYKKNPLDPLKPKWSVVKDSTEKYHWVRLTKWDFKKLVGKSFNALQTTLYDKTVGFHDGAPRGLDFTTDGKNKALKGQYTKLTPKKHDNALFGEMVALKVNIAASALGTTPVGFGELVFDRPGHQFDGMSVKEISARVDSGMTLFVSPLYVQAWYDSALLAVRLINRAFVGVLDTIQFNDYAGEVPKPLMVKGQVQLSAVPYLKAPSPFLAVQIPRLSSEVESPEDFEDEEFEDEEGTPVAAKLYQNYPNPFNPSTTIAFRLLEASKVTVRVFDLLGREVDRVITEEELDKGYQAVAYDARNLSSGIYFYQVEVQGIDELGLRMVQSGKMVLLK